MSVPAASAQLIRALRFAAEKHRCQRRKDVHASPYINHPIAVLGILAEEAGVGDPEVLCAAVLHDTIEDTDTTPAELTAVFGPDVCAIVLAVSDNKRLPRSERKRLQIEHAAQVGHGARLVKLADKIANLRDLVEHPPAAWDGARRREYCDWARAVVERLRGTHAGLEALFDQAYARCLAVAAGSADTAQEAPATACSHQAR
ncbi:MAG: bifunctional (p)ppGpp synthetase/guanosine-3',5'-bis(diphosphate) 3'-pyrophosphohydrolase [Chromatiaceae bacterium]|nr:MAG: bifunctional (p)ppGpp synthetase/guanosine-3',5'-bis(diphosphate) 3'-pyrophosphohydrolase [Chromatiaceae bacterium]